MSANSQVWFCCLLAAIGLVALALGLLTSALLLRIRAISSRLDGTTQALLAHRVAVQRLLVDSHTHGDRLASLACGQRFFSNRLNRLDASLRQTSPEN